MAGCARKKRAAAGRDAASCCPADLTGRLAKPSKTSIACFGFATVIIFRSLNCRSPASYTTTVAMTRRSETTQKKGAKQSSTGKTAAKPTIVNPYGPAAKAEPAKMHDVKSGSPVANKNDKDDPLSNKNRLTGAPHRFPRASR